MTGAIRILDLPEFYDIDGIMFTDILMKAVDPNHDGWIDPTEHEKTYTLIGNLDQDKDGVLWPAEVVTQANAMKSMHQKLADALGGQDFVMPAVTGGPAKTVLTGQENADRIVMYQTIAGTTLDQW